jgi:hypothetical protein
MNQYYFNKKEKKILMNQPQPQVVIVKQGPGCGCLFFIILLAILVAGSL